jgi:hypothetical protein
LIYFIYGEAGSGNTYGGQSDPLFGFAVSFPGSETAMPVEYTVNTVYADE